MDMTHQDSSASTSEDSVPTSKDDQSAPIAESATTKTYTVDEYQRKDSDMHRYKQERNDARKEVEALRTKELEDSENWKAAYERKSEKLVEVETEFSAFKDGYIASERFNKVRAAALKAGLRVDAEPDLELINMDSVRVERTDQGRVLVHDEDLFVEGLKKSRPHWFKSKSVPNFNPGGGGAPPKDKPKELSAAYMVGLEKSDPKKYRELMPEYNRQYKIRQGK